MLKKMLSCLSILLLTLSVLPMSASAQGANGATNLNEMNSGGARAKRATTKHVKANTAGAGFQVLHAFTGGSDGKNPQVGVNLDSSGNIYGATAGESGTNSDWGTIYEYTATGNYSVLYNFQNGPDGYTPKLPLPPNSSGDIYGDALYQAPSIDGIIYQFNPTTNTFTPLYSSGGLLEQGPSSLISDSSGNLYGFGTTGANGFGDVFMFNPITGTFTDLYDFNGGSDGGTFSYGTLLIDASGNLYGATTRGGSSSNYGVVFEVSYSSSGNCPAGSNQSPGSSWCETVLYQFAASDPTTPSGGVAMDASGNLYGTGYSGGAQSSGGVWELTPVSSEPGGVCPAGSKTGNGWCELVLYSFSSSGTADGKKPRATVVLDSLGNLYGLTLQGGAHNDGVLYEITASGQFTALYGFAGGSDGSTPYIAPVLSPSGTTLYGTASSGGSGFGTLWSYGLPTQALTMTLAGTGTGTVTSSPGGISCPGTCSASFGVGVVVTLTETPATNNTFGSWGGACSGTGTCSVTMSADASVTATFNGPTPTSVSCSYSSSITYPTPLPAPACITTPAGVTGTLTYSPSLGTVLSAGNQYVTVTFTPASGSYAASSATVPIQVNQATPAITWPTPAAITFGTALSGTQLDATANVPGTFVYSPAAGTQLTAGSQTLSVIFTPTDTIDYTTASASVTLTVNPGSENCTWQPAPITFGTPLGPNQLDATCTGVNGSSLPGTYVYSPAAGTVLGAGTQTLSVTFTPTDTTDYQTITTSTSLQVSPAVPTIIWNPPTTSITYGTNLSAILDATDSLQYGAFRSRGRASRRVRANDDGSFVYTLNTASGTPVNGTTVLNASSTPYTLWVTFTPNDPNYTTATASISLTVNQASPVITWTAPASITYGTALSSTQLDATANVGGTFAYSPAAGTVLNAGASQTLSVTFTPVDTTDYATATGNTTLTVNQAPQTIALTFNPPTVLIYGAAAGDTFTVTATGGMSGNTVLLTASGACLNSGATYVMTGGPGSTGTCSVIANQAGNSNYLAGSTTQHINEVKKVTLTPPTVSLATTAPSAGALYESQFTVTATTNASTSAVITVSPGAVCTINGSSSGSTVTMKSGSGTCTVTAKWAADEYYSAATATQAVTAAKLASIITWAPPSSITYGPLGSILDATVAGSDGTPLTGTWTYTEAPGPGIPPQTVTAKTVLSVGGYILTANFTPTGTFAKDYAPSAAVTVPLTVTQATTTTTIGSATAGTNPLKVAVDFTVAGQNGGQITGSVIVSDSTGAFTCGATPGPNGTGHCTITFTGRAGANVTLTATYAGDANNSDSVSAPYSTTD